MHRGGRDRLSLLCFQWSAAVGALWHQEGGRPIGGMDPQKHSIGCLRSASKFGDGNWFPLEFQLGDGRGKWRLPAPLFPCQAQLCLPGLDNSPSRCRLALLLSEQSCCQNTLRPAPMLLQARLGGSALPDGLPLHSPSSLPPARVACTASLPFYPLLWASCLHLALESPFC